MWRGVRVLRRQPWQRRVLSNNRPGQGLPPSAPATQPAAEDGFLAEEHEEEQAAQPLSMPAMGARLPPF